jgi:hypothetical protein
MRILKEEAEIQESLPVSFVTDMMSKGWDEVGYLREASAAIKETYKDTAKIEELMQDLMDAYLVFIGQLELYLNNEEDIVAPTEEPIVDKSKAKEAEEEKPVEVVTQKEAPKPELPEADFDIEPLKDPEPFEEPDPLPTPTTEADPFEFFVDFDEPDMSQPALTDAELYDENPDEVRRQLRG